MPGPAGAPAAAGPGLLYPATVPTKATSEQQHPSDVNNADTADPSYIATRRSILVNVDTSVQNMTGCEPGYPSCSEVIAIKLCVNPDHPKRVVHNHCGRQTCKECWPTWAHRAAERSADRIRGYVDASGTKYDPWWTVISPPTASESLPEGQKTIDLLYKELDDNLDILGVTAVEIITHPFRIYNSRMREAIEGAKAKGINKYEWCLQQPHPRDYLYWSPHFHVVGFGFLMDSVSFNKATGWIYKKLRHRPLADLERTLYYLLSHAWYWGPHKRAVRYKRGLSPVNLRVDEEKHYQIERCPICNEPIRKMPVDGNGEYWFQDILNAPYSRVQITLRRYRLKKKRGPPAYSRSLIRFEYDQDLDTPDDGNSRRGPSTT